MIWFLEKWLCKHKHARKIKETTQIMNGMEKIRWVTYYCPDCCKEWTKIEH